MKNIRALSIICAVLTSLFLTNCEHEEMYKTTSTIEFLDKYVSNQSFGDITQEKAKYAISLFENNTIEPQPVLVLAALVKFEGCEETDLALVIYDEDKDILGISICQIPIDSNNTNSQIFEEYPIFVHDEIGYVVNIYRVTVQVRSDSQKKNKTLWDDFCELDYDKYYQGKVADGCEPWSIYEEICPPVWMSTPDPNYLKVQVKVYDKQGNVSESLVVQDRR